MNKLAFVASGIAVVALFSTPCFADAASGPVTCTDGSTSPHGGRGACSKHGGIKKDADGTMAPAAAPAPAAKTAPAPAAAAPAPAAAKPAAAPAAKPAAASATDATGAKAKCKDGTFSHSKTHSGTCSKHGGVQDWLDGSAAK